MKKFILIFFTICTLVMCQKNTSNNSLTTKLEVTQKVEDYYEIVLENKNF